MGNKSSGGNGVCIMKADEMFEDKDKAVSKKKSLVVIIFFLYIIYVISLMFKYIFSLDYFKKN